jgi:hypothetical protein
MSGGHFNDHEYIYYRVDQFADELENDIQNNSTPDEYGYAHEFDQNTIDYLTKQVTFFRKAAKIMKHIDYLYSGDHGEDTFMDIVKNIEGNHDLYCKWSKDWHGCSCGVFEST